MKPRWYFIIATTAALVFAAWYQDFYRRAVAARTQQAENARREHAAEVQRRVEADRVRAAEARRLAEKRRMDLEEKRKLAAQRLAAREDARQTLVHTQGEVAGLRRELDEVNQNITEEETRLGRLRAEQESLEKEHAFLADYIDTAHGNVTRLDAALETFDARRAAAEEAEAARLRPATAPERNL